MVEASPHGRYNLHPLTQCSAVSYSTRATPQRESPELSGCKFPSVGFCPLALCGLMSDVPYFILLDGKQWTSLVASDPSRGAGSKVQGDALTSPWDLDI